MKLGKIKRINDLRSVWQHETKDFSKWLAQECNLQQLSDAIGIDIVLEECESSVGSFNVDLYAIEEHSPAQVPQLTHSSVITYAMILSSL